MIGAAGMGLVRLGAWMERSRLEDSPPVQQVNTTPETTTQRTEPGGVTDSMVVQQSAVGSMQNSQNLTLQRQNVITTAIQYAEPAVVGITVTQVREYRATNPMFNDPLFRYFFGAPDRTYQQKVENLGSGFIISPDGYLVTNEHVVHMASEILVTMHDGSSYNAEVIGADYDTDIALLKIDAQNLPALKIAEENVLFVGEWVIAIGNPFGLFKVNDQASVSVGVVSATGRNFERQEDGRLYRNMIQTDAAINPGNSGGPLVNVLGEVIGVNTFIFTGGGSGSVGVGFALPASSLREVVADLRDRGGVARDFWTGLYVQNIDRMIALSVGYREDYGVIVTEVDPNSPGARAGVQPADIILEIEGTRIADARAIRKYFDNHDLRVGDQLRMKIYRDGKSMKVSIPLEARPSD